MFSFFNELKRRNPILYYFGWLFIAGAMGCIIMTQLDDTIILGINAWIKPLKFFISVAVFSWTMAWYMVYLKNQRKVKAFSIMVVVIMLFEQYVVTWQAANGRLSHFNITSSFYGILFALMGIAITILVLWTGYITYLFFRQKEFPVSKIYIWGIRLGLVFFFIFSFEGGLMASQLSHTVGAPDGGQGLPLVNWSRGYGDLRIAHFFGMHALQLLPFIAYYITKTKTQLFIFSAVYFIAVSLLFVQAIMKMPLV